MNMWLKSSEVQQAEQEAMPDEEKPSYKQHL